MKFSLFPVAAAALSAPLIAAQTPGYNATISTIPSSNTNLTFGQHYAVLNLDMINALVGSVNTTTQGQAFINSTAKWINAVHAQNPVPLSIFTRIYFSNLRRPEIGPNSGFAKTAASITWDASGPQGFVYPAFNVLNQSDVTLQKTRYYAGAGNGLEEILRAQQIDTVILSGIRTSGVILSTVYRLFDLDYKVYVISGNTIETPGVGDAQAINNNILGGVIPKLPADVITLDQALAALKRSGPAIY